MKTGSYDAFKSKDPRFDGRFFVGVSSTGIYCRPTCRAKLPKEDNCTFFATAAAAEQAGYRPCLMCRPELAPGIPINASSTLATRAAKLLEERCDVNIETVAERLGCTGRHLRRVFLSEYGVTPIQYLQTCRLLLAKNLLTDTDLSMPEISEATGFGSQRRFNALFKERYGLTPGSLRKETKTGKTPDGQIALTLGYRPPYRWDEMLDFLSQRAIPGVESVFGGKYHRTVHIRTKEHGDIYGWISVGDRPHRNTLEVTASISLLPVLSVVLSRIRHQFDLRCDPETIYETLASMNEICPGLCFKGTRLPGCFDPFEMAVRAVLGQQITVKAACTLAARVTVAYGKPVPTEIEGLTHIFPSARDILELDGPIDSHLGPLGVTSARANTILRLAKALEWNRIDLDICTNPEKEIERMIEIPGIGIWTAQYIAMRAMGCTDIFLDSDLGVKKALSPYARNEMLDMAENWRPWRSYATINLWNSLNE